MSEEIKWTETNRIKGLIHNLFYKLKIVDDIYIRVVYFDTEEEAKNNTFEARIYSNLSDVFYRIKSEEGKVTLSEFESLDYYNKQTLPRKEWEGII